MATLQISAKINVDASRTGLCIMNVLVTSHESYNGLLYDSKVYGRGFLFRQGRLKVKLPTIINFHLLIQ